MKPGNNDHGPPGEKTEFSEPTVYKGRGRLFNRLLGAIRIPSRPDPTPPEEGKPDYWHDPDARKAPVYGEEGPAGGGPPVSGGGRIRRLFRSKALWFSVLGVFLVLLLVVAGYGTWFYLRLKSFEPRMKQPEVEAALSPVSGAETTLIMGTDVGSVEGEEGHGRSDVLMLISIAPGGDFGGMISIPRDSRVQISGYSGYDKINAAHAYGGAPLAIETVEDLTGLRVNHYVEIEFEGFKQIVDAVGGVPMHIPVAINDIYAGDVPAGDILLTGAQALTLCRARHDVKSVPNGDLDRAKNQRAFLEAMLATVAAQRNPSTLLKVADVVSQSMKTDYSFWGMFRFGRKLQSLRRADSLAMSVAPGAPSMISGVSYYLLDEAAFDRLLEPFMSEAAAERAAREAHAAAEAERAETEAASGTNVSAIIVKVLNGTSVSGLAADEAAALRRLGYTKITTGNSTSPYAETTVYYAPGYANAGQKVASDIGGASRVLENGEVTTRYDANVVYVIGSDKR